MKLSRVLRGGCIGATVAAAVLAAIGWWLDLTIPPWNWASASPGWIGRLLEWSRTTLLLLPPFLVAGLVIACTCALAFEFLTERSGALCGAVVGLLLGVGGADVVGLVPWFSAWFSYAYAPAIRPIGAHDPSWALAAVAVAGVLIGAIAGATYGVPRRAARAARVFRWREIYRSQS